MRTTKASETRTRIGEGLDQKLMKDLKKLPQKFTTNDVKLATDIPYSTLKNQLKRMERKGYVGKELKIYNNRTRWEWFVITRRSNA